MEHTILHADMDAFFASVAQVLHPEYLGKPVIVGGTAERGVVSAASYEARRFGVHSAMPMWKARQLCPRGIYLPVDGPACQEASRRALALYQEYTPRLQPLSIDEVCLDLTGHHYACSQQGNINSFHSFAPFVGLVSGNSAFDDKTLFTALQTSASCPASLAACV